jgi:hypothetical protein
MYSGASASSFSVIQSYRRKILVIAFGAALIGGLSVVVRAQEVAEQGKLVNLAVDDARPVAAAVQLLVEKYGYQITYEDPPYVHEGDLKDRYVKGFKDRVPAGGALNVSFTPSSGMSTATDMAGLLGKLLQAHAVADRGGHFRLVQIDQAFHVLPFEVKDRNGNWGPQTSILDAAISLPNKERAGMAMLEDICAAVGAAGHVHVVVGSIPANVILPYRSMLSAENESARSVLMRALDGTNTKLAWIIMYDPSDGRYWLNIVVVPHRMPSAPNPGATVATPTSEPPSVPQ